MATEFVWAVPADHPAFAGHFPGRPIVPGVVLLDQALRFAEQGLARPPAGWQIGNAKFLSPVGPGEVLRFVLQVKPSGALTVVIHGAGREVAQASLTPVPA